MPDKYQAVTKLESDGIKYLVQYKTVDFCVIITGLALARAEELARIMNSSNGIFINGVYTHDQLV